MNIDRSGLGGSVNGDRPLVYTTSRERMAALDISQRQSAAQALSGASAADRKGMWATMPRAERDAVMGFKPELANLGGLPVTERDRYNRQRLPGLIARTQGEMGNVVAHHVDSDLPDSELLPKLAQLALQRKELLAVANTLGTLDGRAERYLCEIDDQGNALIADRNPDDMQNVATLWFGATTSLISVEKDLERASALRGLADFCSASALSRKSRTSILLASYRAPGNFVDARNPGIARLQAPRAQGIQAGLRASNNRDALMSAVTHSFSGNVLGLAASKDEPEPFDADQLIFTGSPGVRALNVQDLRLKGVAAEEMRNRVFVIYNPFDIATRTPDAIHGPSPHKSKFGAQVYVPADAIRKGAHGSYWDYNSDAMWAVAKIIVGQSDEILERVQAVV